MSDTHFCDLLSNLVINPLEEMQRLNYLFSVESDYYEYRKYFSSGASEISRKHLTLESYIDKYYFRNLSIRKTFINISSFRQKFNIHDSQFTNSIEQLFLFSEFLITLLIECIEYIDTNEKYNKSYFPEQATTIIDNIRTIVDCCNYEVKETGNHNFIIVEKNPMVSHAIESIDDPSIILDSIEYNHYSTKHDLAKKRKILTALGNYVEPLLKDKTKFKDSYPQLTTDIGFLLNNFHIRHDNKNGKNARTFVIEANDAELEQWYDDTYTMIMSLLLVNHNVDCSQNIKQIKQKYNL